MLGATSVRSTAQVNGREYPVTHVRHLGRWISAVVFLAVFAWLVSVFASSPNIKWSEVGHYLFNPSILDGIKTTILISLEATVLGLILAVILAVMKISHNPVTSALATLYIWFFRGTPVLVQLIFWYNLALVFPTLSLGIPGTSFQAHWTTNDVMTGFNAAMLGLGLNLAAYAAETVRAGIQAVGKGQSEAADALGMTPGQRMRIVVLPQALRIIIPPIGNEFISMLKTTSLVYVVAGADLMTNASHIYLTNGEVIELLIVASLWYLLMTAVATVFQSALERHYDETVQGRRVKRVQPGLSDTDVTAGR